MCFEIPVPQPQRGCGTKPRVARFTEGYPGSPRSFPYHSRATRGEPKRASPTRCQKMTATQHAGLITSHISPASHNSHQQTTPNAGEQFTATLESVFRTPGGPNRSGQQRRPEYPQTHEEIATALCGRIILSDHRRAWAFHSLGSQSKAKRRKRCWVPWAFEAQVFMWVGITVPGTGRPLCREGGILSAGIGTSSRIPHWSGCHVMLRWSLVLLRSTSWSARQPVGKTAKNYGR